MDIKKELRKFYEENYSEDDMDMEPMAEPIEDMIEEPVEEPVEQENVSKADLSHSFTGMNPNKKVPNIDISANNKNRVFDYLFNLVPEETKERLHAKFDPMIETDEGQLKVIRLSEQGDADAQAYIYLKIVMELVYILRNKFTYQVIMNESISVASDINALLENLLNSPQGYNSFYTDVAKGYHSYYFGQFCKRLIQKLKAKMNIYASENFINYSSTEYYDTHNNIASKEYTSTDLEFDKESLDMDSNQETIETLTSTEFSDDYNTQTDIHDLFNRMKDYIRKYDSEMGDWFDAYLDYKLDGIKDNMISEMMGLSPSSMAYKKKQVFTKLRDEFSDAFQNLVI